MTERLNKAEDAFDRVNAAVIELEERGISTSLDAKIHKELLARLETAGVELAAAEAEATA